MPDGDKRHGSYGSHGRSRSGGQAEGRTSGGKAGREGGERDTDGHAPGERRRGTRRSTAADREQGENEKKRYINI